MKKTRFHFNIRNFSLHREAGEQQNKNARVWTSSGGGSSKGDNRASTTPRGAPGQGTTLPLPSLTTCPPHGIQTKRQKPQGPPRNCTKRAFNGTRFKEATHGSREGPLVLVSNVPGARVAVTSSSVTQSSKQPGTYLSAGQIRRRAGTTRSAEPVRPSVLGFTPAGSVLRKIINISDFQKPKRIFKKFFL